MSPAPSNALLLISLIALFLIVGSFAIAMLLFSRRVRFSLAALLLFVLAAGLICGAVSYHLRAVGQLQDQLAMERERAIAAMELAERERTRAELLQAGAQNK